MLAFNLKKIHFAQLDGLFLSLTLGAYFLLMQAFEYKTVNFHINDSSFGSIFYLLTGLHGMHVIVGLIFLGSCYLRLQLQTTSENNLSLHFGAWYWHFVDIVWLILYLVVYTLPYIIVVVYSKQVSVVSEFNIPDIKSLYIGP